MIALQRRIAARSKASARAKKFTRKKTRRDARVSRALPARLAVRRSAFFRPHRVALICSSVDPLGRRPLLIQQKGEFARLEFLVGEQNNNKKRQRRLKADQKRRFDKLCNENSPSDCKRATRAIDTHRARSGRFGARISVFASPFASVVRAKANFKRDRSGRLRSRIADASPTRNHTLETIVSVEFIGGKRLLDHPPRDALDRLVFLFVELRRLAYSRGDRDQSLSQLFYLILAAISLAPVARQAAGRDRDCGRSSCAPAAVMKRRKSSTRRQHAASASGPKCAISTRNDDENF